MSSTLVGDQPAGASTGRRKLIMGTKNKLLLSVVPVAGAVAALGIAAPAAQAAGADSSGQWS
ncbi:MAG TPA: hypothetical protein VFJ12_12980 [Segeticoccus sp.]|nr:hypothetical protein [Segeticoccus sp.]